jgi:hypothetical protein
VRVSAQVIDVASLAPAPFPVPASDRTAPDAGTLDAATVAAPSGRSFSVVPPRHSAVAVSMQVRGAAGRARQTMAIRVCRPPAVPRANCRRVPFADSLGSAEAAAVTEEAVLLSLLGLTEVAADTAFVILTLAYPGT